MSTYPPTLTTEELVQACADAVPPLEVSVTQLTSWVREGLIPKHLRHRHGRGQGMGTEWLWESECLPRALIIGRTLAHEAASKGKSRGFPRGYDRAALMLAALGYAPDVERLRALLIAGVDRMEALLVKRQIYLTASYSEKEKRRALRDHFRRAVNRKVIVPSPLLTNSMIQFTEALHGLAEVQPAVPTGNEPGTLNPGEILAFQAMRDHLRKVSGRRLIENYHHAELLATQLDTMWEWLAAFLMAFIPDSTVVQTTESREVTILGLTHESAGYFLRLMSTVLHTIIPEDELSAIESGQSTRFTTWVAEVLTPLIAHAGLSWPGSSAKEDVPPSTDGLQNEKGRSSEK